MTIMAPVSGFSLAALARLATLQLPLPDAATPSTQSRSPDVVVFSSAPFRLLSDLASAGLKQLVALLPALEQAVQENEAAPIGHLAKAAAAAARQIADGHVALLAEGPERVAASLRGELPTPPSATPSDARQALRTLARQLGTAPDEPAPDARTSETLRTVARQIGMAERLDSPHPSSSDPEASPIRRWLGEADLVLRSTGDALDRAEQRLTAQAVTPDSPSVWVLAQIAAAQAQVNAAHGSIGQSLREPRRIAAAITSGSFAFPTDHLAGATTMFGMLLVLATLWLAGGLWSLVTGTAGLVAVGFWVMRISRASSGIRLDPQR